MKKNLVSFTSTRVKFGIKMANCVCYNLNSVIFDIIEPKIIQTSLIRGKYKNIEV